MRRIDVQAAAGEASHTRNSLMLLAMIRKISDEWAFRAMRNRREEE